MFKLRLLTVSKPRATKAHFNFDSSLLFFYHSFHSSTVTIEDTLQRHRKPGLQRSSTLSWRRKRQDD